jgi:hypothetical protein
MNTPMKPTQKERAEMRAAHAASKTKVPSELTDDEVRAIRAGRAAGTGAFGLALRYKVKIGAVYDIHKRRARADVPSAFETQAQRQDRERRHQENVECAARKEKKKLEKEAERERKRQEKLAKKKAEA